MTDTEKLESIRCLIRARELVYDDWVSIEALKSIVDDGLEPSHVAWQLGETTEL